MLSGGLFSREPASLSNDCRVLFSVGVVGMQYSILHIARQWNLSRFLPGNFVHRDTFDTSYLSNRNCLTPLKVNQRWKMTCPQLAEVDNRGYDAF